MNKLITTILIIIISLPAFSVSDNFEQKFQKANELYGQNNYEDALKLYKEIIAEGCESADLYYNIANTYYRLNVVGLSVCYYEKAKKTDPLNEDIIYNLDLAKLRINNNPVVIPEFAVISFFKKIIMCRTNEFWGIISLILFTTFLVSLFLYLYSKSSRQKKIRFLLSVLIFIFSVISFLFAQYQTGRLNSEDIGIIITAEINAKSSPDENATNLFKIYEGYKVFIEKKSNEWSEIKLTDGKKAWIKTENIKLL
ncbi:MAG: hypothetical protein K8R54_04710 [Bacteroidales bacterium]|nr:hypothetical protein [Bacteroidales bacterium]